MVRMFYVAHRSCDFSGPIFSQLTRSPRQLYLSMIAQVTEFVSFFSSLCS